MKHLDEGTLRALLDGETVAEDVDSVREHLDGCEHCRTLLEELRNASSVVGAALARLDTAVPPEDAKAAVLARVTAGARTITPTTVTGRFAFARAAVLVLFFGAAIATALLASPVRGWIVGGWDRAVAMFTGSTETESAVAPAATAATPQAPESAGVRVEVPTGELVVLLEDVEPGTELDVRFVDGFQAAAFAAQPARFRTADGLIEVTGGAGLVRVDIPRSVDVASIHVNGRMCITKAGDELDVAGPIVTRTPGEIRMRVQ